MDKNCYSCGNIEGEWDIDLEEIVKLNEDQLCSACVQNREYFGDDSWMSVYWLDRFITINGKTYHSIAQSGNVHFCSECIRPVFGIPLLIWGDGGKTMIAFCNECAKRIVGYGG